MQLVSWVAPFGGGFVDRINRICRIVGQGLYELRADDGAASLAYRQQTRCDAEPIESVYHDGRIAMTAFRIIVGGVIQARYGDECRKHH